MTLLDDLKHQPPVRIKRVQPRTRYQFPDWHPTERAREDYLADRLEPYFHVARQVRGTHAFGRTVIADLMLVPREPWGQGTSRRPIAVELKRSTAAMRDEYAQVGQAVDYTYTRWNNLNERFPTITGLPGDGRTIAAVVAITVRETPDSEPLAPVYARDIHWQHLLGRLNIATITHHSWQGLQLRMTGERQWSEAYGHRAGGWRAEPRTGSR